MLLRRNGRRLHNGRRGKGERRPLVCFPIQLIVNPLARPSPPPAAHRLESALLLSLLAASLRWNAHKERGQQLGLAI